MRSRTLFTFLLVAGSLALPLVAYAGIPFFGPIVPNEINRCAAGWGAVITVINNIIRFLLTLVIVFVAPLMIAYSGFLFVVNPVNSGGIAKAKSVLLNTIIGIVIAFAGWLIVDAIMAVLYHPTDPSLAGKAWSELITSGGQAFCLVQEGALKNLNQSDLSGANITGVSANGGAFLSLPTNGNCTPDSLLAATAGSQYALSQSQANTLSCIAVPESTCGRNVSQARQPDGTPTSASGMFQIVFGSGNDTCHNLNIPSCSQAAGVSGDLNCYSAFRGGLPRAGKEIEAAACKRAAANLNCNAQAAGCLVKARNGGFSDWTADPRAATQQNCVTQYANK
ncbi:MAG: pilin [Candidatus Parcubacteria bacterium]|nr:pilin [Candidatus Parcubacteria bacterium]